MAEFGIDVDPGEAGLDARRLQRIDTHFRRYVDDGRLAGWQVMVSRHGKVAHLTSYGLADKEAGRPVETDTLWRIFSMTKAVTSVAAMMLWEEGAFELNDPISQWLPEFAAPRVYTGGPASKPVTVPATEPIRVWHLLTHTAGLTYGFLRVHVTDELHRLRGFDVGAPEGLDLAHKKDRGSVEGNGREQRGRGGLLTSAGEPKATSVCPPRSPIGYTAAQAALP